ncbi:pyrroloquinoline quinone biosynthesis protein B [Endobacter medicaginis]|uniref:Coenzyme PQQ synthesis protein B n=3 Tax=Endobacter medicaginis TaxID=1181271 RepID=A0A839V0J0_9PROT|nr:pyrroloquinoline quinone biosynthesis protein PqqB [Endobacter medicaginis]MBB3173152.1 pyrroloquinoline quinone biosynthesis protein B [Endobacter medicaginis]MCX5476094.1 pyrroloquinoline quinone biosynthesis protein PqqB [Endobacter medicaginis]
MRVIVLGSGAGGGVPQWNSGAPACRLARAGDPTSPPRTQTGLAVSDGTHWFLLNTSPDLRQQLAAQPALHPPEGVLRGSPIAGVVLTGGEIDAIAGLLTLREGHAFGIRATATVCATLAANPIFQALPADRVPRLMTLPDQPFPLGGLTATLFRVPGKRPLHAEAAGHEIAETDDTVGVEIVDGGRRMIFIPGCAAITEAMVERIDGADLLFIDATLWRDDEMVAGGYSAKTGQRMGHVSISGENGVLDRLAGCRIEHKVLIHINNTNPVLLAKSLQRARVLRLGWRVAHDGLEFNL